MTKLVLLLGVALALTVTAAGAEDTLSANSVLPGCREIVDGRADDLFGNGRCMGLIAGIVSMGTVAAGALSGLDDLGVDRTALGLRAIRSILCIDAPNEVTLRQATRVIVAYIEARPERRDE